MTGDTLWHYTNVNACQSILESKELRLTNVWTYRCRPETEADWREFTHGLDIFSNAQHGRSAKCVWSDLDDIVRLYSPFVMCFSKSDANDTLWNQRAGEHGVCLGFSRNEFFNVFHKCQSFNTSNGTVTYDLCLRDCIYNSEKKNRYMLGNFSGLNVGFRDGEPSFPIEVLFRAVFLKREYFFAEQEARLALATSQLPVGVIPGLSYRQHYSLAPEQEELPIIAVTVTSIKAREKIASMLKMMGYSNVDITLRSVT